MLPLPPSMFDACDWRGVTADRAAIDQTARRIAQGDGPEARARLDTYSRFMREDGDE